MSTVNYKVALKDADVVVAEESATVDARTTTSLSLNNAYQQATTLILASCSCRTVR